MMPHAAAPVLRAVPSLLALSLSIAVCSSVAVCSAEAVDAEAEDAATVTVDLGGEPTESTAAPQPIEYALLTMDGQPVGYQTHEVQTIDGELVSDEVMRIKLKRFGQDFEMVTTLRSVESSGGRLESAEMTIVNAGQVAQKVMARRDGNEMVVSQQVAGKTTDRRVPIGDDVQGPLAVQRLLEDGPLAKGETDTLKLFSVETLSVAELTRTGLGERPTKTRGGKPVRLAAEQSVRSDVPVKMVTYFQMGGQSPAIMRTDLGMLDLVAWPSTREEAIASYGTGDVDLGLETVVAVTPMPGLARDAKATLLVRGTSAPLPASIWQRVEPVPDSDQQRVTSRRIDVRQFRGVGTPRDAEIAAASLRSSRYLDFEAPEVQKVLAKAPEPREAAGESVAEMAAYVRSVVEQVGFGVGFATASTVCETKEGDCSEHAVLLAALLRARKIPARVAIGLVYGDRYSAFVPHMWTEAYLETQPGSGKMGWVPIDATRPTQSVGPAYITFGTSLLESDAPLAITDLINLSQSLGTLSIRRIE